MENLSAACRKKILIAAHRGVSGGNIPCNTMASYKIAFDQGADILEIDLNRTSDGKLIIFHPKMEPNHLCFDGSVRDMTLDQIRANLRYVNYDRTPTEWSLCTFDEVLEEFRGKCYINVDKFWDFPAEIADTVRRHGMTDQIIVKASPKPQVIDVLEEIAPDIMFLPIFKGCIGNTHEELKKRNIRYVGAELVFADESCESASRLFRDILHAEGRIAWANSILYDYRVPLAAGHSDDVSLTEDPALGWGWLVDAGFDIIQTDWTLPMKLYLEQSGKLFRN